MNMGALLGLDGDVAARAVEARRTIALDPVPSELPAGSSVQAVLVTPILVLAGRATPTVLADATSLVVLQGGVGRDRLADSIVAALPALAGSVHQPNVTERPSPVWAAGAKPTGSKLDAGSSVAALTQPFAGDEVCQPAFALGAIVLRRAEATTRPSISNPSSTMSTIAGQTDIVLTQPPLVHGIRTKALWLAVLQMACTVVLAGETQAGALLYTSWAGDAGGANATGLPCGRVQRTVARATLQSWTSIAPWPNEGRTALTLARRKAGGVVLAPLVALLPPHLATRSSETWRAVTGDHLLASRTQAGVTMTTIEAVAGADVGLAKLSSEIWIADTAWLASVFKLATTLVAVERLTITGGPCLFSALAALQQPAFCAQALVGQIVLVLWN